MLRRPAMSPYVLGLHSHQRSCTALRSELHLVGLVSSIPNTQALMEAIIGEVRRSK
jgi:hypothetical protein